MLQNGVENAQETPNEPLEADINNDSDFAEMAAASGNAKPKASSSGLLKAPASPAKALTQNNQPAQATKVSSNKPSNLNAKIVDQQKSQGIKKILQSLFGFGDDSQDDSTKKGLMAKLGLDFGGIL